MGYAISWIALRGKSVEEATKLLGLARTGDTEEIPESMFSGTALKTGWYVVVINEYGHRLIERENLEAVSESAELIAVCIEEHVMASSAECWKGGDQRWSVGHQSESGITHLEEEGRPPDIYAAIKQRLLAAQKTAEDVDHVFDVPLELAEAITGYKHDKMPETNFEILTESPQPSGGFFGRLFGKK